MYRISQRTQEGVTWNHQEFTGLGTQRLWWLASYPRSGNTYFRICFERMFSVRTFSVYETQENCQFPYDCDGDEPCILVKTHNLPAKTKWPAILIVRDGRESLASWAHYNRKDGEDYHQKLASAINGDLSWCWSKFHGQWLDYPHLRVIRFLDLISDPAGAILGAMDCESLGLVRAGDPPAFEELHSQSPGFFRGGNWKADFTPELLELFWKKHGKMMNRLGF